IAESWGVEQRAAAVAAMERRLAARVHEADSVPDRGGDALPFLRAELVRRVVPAGEPDDVDAPGEPFAPRRVARPARRLVDDRDLDPAGSREALGDRRDVAGLPDEEHAQRRVERGPDDPDPRVAGGRGRTVGAGRVVAEQVGARLLGQLEVERDCGRSGVRRRVDPPLERSELPPTDVEQARTYVEPLGARRVVDEPEVVHVPRTCRPRPQRLPVVEAEEDRRVAGAKPEIADLRSLVLVDDRELDPGHVFAVRPGPAAGDVREALAPVDLGAVAQAERLVPLNRVDEALEGRRVAVGVAEHP